MKILPVSEFSFNKINFEAKKEKNEVSQVSSSVKKAVPTAALVLAMMADPIAVNKAEAATLDNDKTEMQWHPYHHHHHHHYPRYRYYNPYQYVLPTMMMLNYIQSMAYLNNVYNAPVSVGGVAINRSDIASANTYSQDNMIYNNVVLNNGTSLTYPNQYEGRYPVIYKGQGGYVIEGLENAYIVGSNSRDKYTLKGCRNTTVDVGGDERIDNVFVTKYRTVNGQRQYTENVEVIASSGDVVNNQKIYDDDTTLTYDGY